MPLILAALVSSLQTGWLVDPGGSHAQSNLESGDRFAGAVANWFTSAQAAGFPCLTAAPRRPELASSAASALALGDAGAAGNALALAVAGYIAGQLFGTGVASFPAALGGAATQFAAVFGDHELSNADRARQLASACTLLAASTLVVFPAPPLAAPIM